MGASLLALAKSIYYNLIISNIRGKRSKGRGREFKSETAREGEARRGTSSPPSFLARPLHASSAPKISFSFPLERLARRLDYLSNSGKMECFYS